MLPSRPVAVLGADSPIGLTVIRELGARGVPVIALGKGPRALGRHSRYTRHFAVMQGPLADWLPQFVAEHGVEAVFAISEHHLLELAALKGTLDDCKVLCPNADRLALVLDKQRTLEVAAGLGIDVPQSWQPLPGEDFAGRYFSLGWVVFLRWLTCLFFVGLTSLCIQLDSI